MSKKSVVALALFAALFTTTQAFAQTKGPDLVITSARLLDGARVEITVQNRGFAPATTCLSEVRYIGSATSRPNLTVPAYSSCQPLAAGETRAITIQLPTSVILDLLRQGGRMVYFQASADCNNAVPEWVDVAGARISLESNNGFSFAAMR